MRSAAACRNNCPSKIGGEDADPCRIAIWPSERFYQSLLEHIVRDPDDRKRFGRLLYGANCHAPASIDDVGFGFDQLRRIFGNQINVRCKIAVINAEVLALNKSATLQFVEERNSNRPGWRNKRAEPIASVL